MSRDLTCEYHLFVLRQVRAIQYIAESTFILHYITCIY